MLIKSAADTKLGGIANIFSDSTRIPEYKLRCYLFQEGFCDSPRCPIPKGYSGPSFLFPKELYVFINLLLYLPAL